MKKLILVLSTIVLGIFTLQSCKEEDCVVETTDIKLDKKEVALTAKGQNGIVKILSGEGTFKAVDFDSNIIKVMVAGRTLTIVPLKAGNTEVTVTNSFKEATFKVTVQAPDIALQTAKVEVKEGEMVAIPISSGSGAYTPSVDNTNAKAEVKDGKVIITGVKGGTAKVTVKDNETGKTVVVDVAIIEVIPVITIEKPSVEVAEGGKAEIAITAGSGEYTATADDEKANVEVKDGKVIITGLKEGTSKITITDTKTNEKAVVNITVAKASEIVFDKIYVDPISGATTTKGGLTFIVGDKEENRTITAVKGTAPFIVKYKKTGKYDKVKSTFEVKENKIIFTANEFVSEAFIVTDANGKTNEIEVNVRKALEVKGLHSTKIEVLVGQTINKKEEIRVEGLASRITIKENSKPEVVEAKIEESQNTASRAVILKGLKVGESVLTITDGVVEKKVTVTVKESEAMKVYKEDGTTELKADAVYELGKFMIKGGVEEFTVTAEPANLIVPIKEVKKGFSSQNFEFELVRNTNVAQGGEATITVKDKNNEEFKFKVNCPTLLEAIFKIAGKEVPKADEGDDARYIIATGMYAGYNLRNIAVDDLIELTMANGSGAYTVKAKDSDIIEVIQNGDNKTFTIKVKKKGTYYGDIVIADKKDPKKVIKITRIYVERESAGTTGTYEDLTVEKAAVEVEEGAEISVAVAGGSLKYSVASADEKIAKAGLKEDKVVITGVKAGKVKVTVTDTKTKKTAEITVTVKAKTGTATKKVAVTGITLNKTKFVLAEGKTVEVKATVTPENATDKTVVWTSSKPAVAKVDANGKITTIKAGKTTIKATTKDGKKFATCQIIVSGGTVAPTNVTVTGVKINEKEVVLEEGAVLELKATVAPENATDKTVTWTIDKKDIATVDANGKVTAKKAGEALLTVTTKDGNKKATCKVTVKVKAVTPADVAVKETAKEVTVEEKVEVEITNGSGEYSVAVDNGKATAEIKDKKVVITGVGAGTAKVTVTDTKTNKTAEIEVTVKAKQINLAVAKASTTIKKGAKEVIAITGGKAPYTVASDDNGKATAEIKDTNKVEITAKADNGTATITVTDANNKTATIEVTLEPAPEITFDKKGTDWQGNPLEDGKVEFILGQTGAVTEITVLTGTPPYTVAPKYSWSTPKSTFTIDGNKITFTSTTDCSDSYKVTDANGKERALDVKVYKAISVTPTSYTVLTNQTIEDKITVKGKADAFEIKSGYDTNVVTPSFEGTSSLNRKLKLVGGSVGSTTIKLTDGVNEVDFNVTVQAPQALQIFKGGAAVGTAPYAEDDAKFVIKGGTGKYDVTYILADGSTTKLLENSKISEVYNEPGSYSLDISRNKGVREGGEVTVTVTRQDDTNDSKSFKVTCATLSSFEISIDGAAVPKKDSAESPYANPHYVIATGFYGGRYDVYVPVGKTVDFKVLNGTANKYTIKVGGYGKDNGEVVETADNKTFKVKTKVAGNYYVDVYDESGSKVLDMIVRIQ